MKKLLLFLLAAMALASAVPTAQAYKDDPWSTPNKMLRSLHDRLDAVDAKRHRYGASRELSARINDIHDNVRALDKRVAVHGGEPRVSKQLADAIGSKLDSVEADYRAYLRGPGVTVHVWHPW